MVAITLAPLGFLELDNAALIGVAAKTGFSSVAIRAMAAVPGGVEYRISPGSAGLRETRAALAATGVSLAQLEMIALTAESKPSDYEAMLEGGAELGCRRVVASGNDPDLALMADKFAEACDVAARYGMAVDLEFMPFRPLATLPQSLTMLDRAARPNGKIMLDALHLMRSGGSVDMLADIEPGRIELVQLCDGPLQPPWPDDLVHEAREARLVPDEGAFPLEEIMRALPADVLIAAECPIQQQYAGHSAEQRAELIFRATSGFLRRIGRS